MSVAIDFFLPPERLRFGLVLERLLLSSLGVGDSGSWFSSLDVGVSGFWSTILYFAVLVVQRFLEKGMISKLLCRSKIHFLWSLYVSDHVAVSLPGGRILISAGSMASLHSASQLYILDPTDEKPTWRLLNVLGRPLRFAWGHSICVVGGRRAIVLGGQTGEEAIKHFSK